MNLIIKLAEDAALAVEIVTFNAKPHETDGLKQFRTIKSHNIWLSKEKFDFVEYSRQRKADRLACREHYKSFMHMHIPIEEIPLYLPKQQGRVMHINALCNWLHTK